MNLELTKVPATPKGLSHGAWHFVYSQRSARHCAHHWERGDVGHTLPSRSSFLWVRAGMVQLDRGAQRGSHIGGWGVGSGRLHVSEMKAQKNWGYTGAPGNEENEYAQTGHGQACVRPAGHGKEGRLYLQGKGKLGNTCGTWRSRLTSQKRWCQWWYAQCSLQVSETALGLHESILHKGPFGAHGITYCWMAGAQACWFLVHNSWWDS